MYGKAGTVLRKGQIFTKSGYLFPTPLMELGQIVKTDSLKPRCKIHKNAAEGRSFFEDTLIVEGEIESLADCPVQVEGKDILCKS